MSDVDLLIVGDLDVKVELLDSFARYSADHGLFFDVIFQTLEGFKIWRHHPLVKEALINGIYIKKDELIDEML